MERKTESICGELLTLPHQDRAYLATRLIYSLDDTVLGKDDELSSEWKAELDRRLEDIRSGHVHGISEEEVEAQLDEILRNAR